MKKSTKTRERRKGQLEEENAGVITLNPFHSKRAIQEERSPRDGYRKSHAE
jgi:hypothetical protein